MLSPKGQTHRVLGVTYLRRRGDTCHDGEHVALPSLPNLLGKMYVSPLFPRPGVIRRPWEGRP